MEGSGGVSPLILSDVELTNQLMDVAARVFKPSNKTAQEEWAGRIVKFLDKVSIEEYATMRRSLLKGLVQDEQM